MLFFLGGKNAVGHRRINFEEGVVHRQRLKERIEREDIIWRHRAKRRVENICLGRQVDRQTS